MKSPPVGLGRSRAAVPAKREGAAVDVEKPQGISADQIALELERGRTFQRNEAKVREVVATTFSELVAFECTAPESDAIKDKRIELLGSVRLGELKYGDEGREAEVSPAKSDIKIFGGHEYYELPNSTSLVTTNPETGEARELVITRGVRPYKNSIKPSAGIFNRPQGYVSDLLLFERRNGGLEYVDTLLFSDPGRSFFFEDPRISVITEADGRARYFLSGTDYSKHVPGDDGLFVRNGYVELELDATGLPKRIPVSKRTAKPKFKYMSPPPSLVGEDAIGIDAKNGIIAQRDDGKIVVRTRFRPDFERDPVYQKYRERFGDETPRWAYGVQTFVFDSLEDLEKYDWKNALDLVLARALGTEPILRAPPGAPKEAKLVLTDGEIGELYPADQLAPGKPRGFGPGTRPIRVRRDEDRLLVSDGPNGVERIAGRVPASHQGKGAYAIADGEVLYLSFDHKLRYMHQANEAGEVIAEKRVYSGQVTLWENSLTDIRRVYDDVVQPKAPHQIGLTGIMDLHHAGYHMGVSLVPEREGECVVRVFAGEADAHTVSYDWDLGKLLLEMSPGSDREQSGQVYAPRSP